MLAVEPATSGRSPRASGAPPLGLLIGLSLIGPLSTHLVVPSLPKLQHEFGVGYSTVQLLVSLFILAFGGAQIVVGALSDAFGRRRVLLAGLGIFTIASALCAFAPNMEALIALRILQGASGCIGIVLARAIVRDIFDGRRTAQALGYLAVGTAMGPMLAPLAGGLIYEAFGWVGPFSALAAFSGTALLLSWFLIPETSGRAGKGFTVGPIFGDFALLLRSREFLLYSANVCFNTALFYSFVIGAAFIAISELGLSPAQYGLWLACVAVGYALGNFLSGSLSFHIDPMRAILLGSGIVALAILAIVLLFAAGHVSAAALFLPMALATFASGFIMPNSMAGLLAVDPGKAGSASGLLGFLQFAFAAAFSSLGSDIVEGGAIRLAVLMLGLAVAGLASAACLAVRRP